MSPTYVYRCPGCGAGREERHGMDENPFVSCWLHPDRIPMKRVIQPVGFRTPGGNGFFDKGRV